MAEKRGETVKLVYDFNTAGLLEIFINEKWVRVTAKDFRSFDGPRRITQPTTVEHGNVHVPMETFEYWGPVFMYGTNNEMAYTNSGSMYTGAIWDRDRKRSEERGR